MLTLASASPRRRELLGQLGIEHRVLPVHIDEDPQPGEGAEAFVARVALDKARAGQAGAGPGLVMGADTAVVVDGQILGKPRDRQHALEMLALLSGRSHQVLSAVALVEGEHEALRVCPTRVWFRYLDAGEAARYWATGEPADKAGAYAIQGLGAVFVTRIDGSYSAVMGLPLFETADLMRQFGIDVLAEG